MTTETINGIEWTVLDGGRRACGESKREPFEVPEVESPKYGAKVI